MHKHFWAGVAGVGLGILLRNILARLANPLLAAVKSSWITA